MYKNRLTYIDNLRLFIIILVVLQHIVVTYSGFGDWYYKEPVQTDILQDILFIFHLSFVQGYSMGFLFLIAGYFIPASYEKKGFKSFIKDKLIRLGIPTIVYTFIIHPFTYYFLMNQRIDDKGLVDTYLEYIFKFRFIGGTSLSWFTFTLLIFTIVYAFFRKLTKITIKTSNKNFPEFSKILILIFLISICTFLTRIVFPVGTKILNMRICYFSQYIILFIIGTRSKHNKWFESVDYSYGRRWLISGLVLGFISFISIMVLGEASSDNYDLFNGGISWQSAAYAIWESFVSVAMSIGLISLFKEKYNRQNKLIKTMSDNAFSVYLFHAPIIITLSMLFTSVNLIPIIKCILFALASIPLCFLIANITIRKIPFLQKYL